MLQNTCVPAFLCAFCCCFLRVNEVRTEKTRLCQIQIVDGVLTQDTDAFLYGATVVYRDLTITEKVQYRDLPNKHPWALAIHGPKNGGGRLHGEAICTYNAYTHGP